MHEVRCSLIDRAQDTRLNLLWEYPQRISGVNRLDDLSDAKTSSKRKALSRALFIILL